MAALLKKILAHGKQTERLLSGVERKALPHALLFSGPSGVGKRLTALGVAQAILCAEKQAPCGWCVDCRKVESHHHENVLLIEPTQRQIKIETIREISQFLGLKAWGNRSRIIIIDSAQTMNPQAANALLKSLEEPPEDTYFILICNQVQGLMPTIRSRCQALHFGSLSLQHLKQLRPDATDWVLSAAQGRLDLVDQLGGEEHRPIREQVFQCWQRLLDHEPVAFLSDWHDHLNDREQALIWTQFHMQVVRDALVAKSGSQHLLHRDQSRLVERLAEYPSEALLILWDCARALEEDLRGNVERNLASESFLLKAQEVLQ